MDYRDPQLSVERRVDDLVGRMTLEEKAGLLFQAMVTMGDIMPIPSATDMIDGRLMNHFNLFGSASGREMAEWSNAVQERAKATRLGIPVTISTDPRHSFSSNPGAAMMAGAFSQWPETTGLAAIGDEALVEKFADIARQEYLAVGIRVALHPQIDLATEPRWARANATFGEDAELTSRLVKAYIRGFQGVRLGKDSVACMTKHFPGGGPQKDGEDPHFAYGREQVYPGGNFDYHLKPFEAAFEAGTSQIMPYYGMPVGTPYEEVGFGFNKDVITGLLRERYGFDGIVCTDWGLLTDDVIMGQPVAARAWGVEHLTPLERAKKALDAGIDQFGGEACPELVIELVRSGQIAEERIDVSVRRLLREKFVLGLFDDPFADPDRAEEIVGRADFVQAGVEAQSASLTLLKNGPLPLVEGLRMYVEGVDAETAAGYGTIVATPEEADIALVRLAAPYEPRPGMFESFFHAGDLAFPEAEIARLRALQSKADTVVDVYLERPAVFPEIAEGAVAVLGDFGANDAVFLDVVFGRRSPLGRLPYELPRSMAAVEASRSDMPYDSEDPLYPFGHGLSY
ncbi:glycoside hydrolase family 3 C-terminal domain-containing protein [Streptosporangium sp. NBC_01755]|uniref:glycoside hydrolase family 3 protein n=1 Tax=unclassified Streptosporangium TaxID=2632669 RepID=UPI002DD98684|nr:MULTISPECIES: glycoside hydrolase family 3 N-terminal domain-containing protein [unclassified Streptosporangium]WSA23545.1 glycoside hydrolase family 3 C-terminal domain-containing protein [Streptosporangium sp. NBC_01810]WSC98245.1 glycoside hydrolase family 3 C-terminal domain-containing protein [Streptosporangium sp. NBC_01755]